MKNVLRLAAASALLALCPVANATVTITPVDSGADGSFTLGVAGTDLSKPVFSESFQFSTTVAGFLNAFVGTTGTGDNNVDFTSVTISGGTLGGPVALSQVLADPETRAVSGLALGVGTYTFTTAGTSVVGGNGSYGGSVAFSVPSVPEPATWLMMLVGFAAVGFGLRGNRKSAVATKVSYNIA